MRHGLTDEQWNVIEDIFPEPAETGRPPANPRKMLEAMIWINNTGAKWRDLPPKPTTMANSVQAFRSLE